MSVPFQRLITIGDRPQRSKESIYATINIDALQQAMNDLNGSSGLLLWLYLDKNADGFKLELSQKAAAAWGLKRDSYYRAFGELVEKGYLQPTAGGRYAFYEVPRGAQPPAEAAQTEKPTEGKISASSASGARPGNSTGERLEAAQRADLAAQAQNQNGGQDCGRIYAKSESMPDSATTVSDSQQRNITQNTKQNTVKVDNQKQKKDTQKQKVDRQKQQPATYDTIEAAQEAAARMAAGREPFQTVPAEVYNTLAYVPVDLGAGFVLMSTGRIFRIEGGAFYPPAEAAAGE